MSLRNWERENAYTESDVHLLQTVANSMSVALENARLFDETRHLLKETEQRATELQIINNIGQILTEGLDPNIMLKRVAERLHEALKVENIAITVSDASTGHVIARDNFYVTRTAFAADRFLLEKFKLLMRLSARGGGRSWVVNTNAEKSWRKFGADVREGDSIPKSFVALPLLAGSDAIGGIIFADYEKENTFADISISMLEIIASNLGTAIQNTRLFDETQRLLKETEQRATELQIINNIGQTLTEGLDLQSTIERVGERLCEALNVENIGIAAFDPKNDLVIAQYMVRDGKQITSNQFTAGKFKFAIRFASRYAGKSWVVNNKLEKTWLRIAQVIEGDEIPKSWVMLPLVVGKEVIGGISIADYEKENAFTELPIGMLETISSNLGTAIQNVRLFDETQRLLKETEQRATELQIINNIGQTLTEGGDLNSTIQRVGERIQEALNVKDIVISVFDEKSSHVLSPYMVRNGKQIEITEENIDLRRFKLGIRASARAGGRSWVVNKVAEKTWRKWWISMVDNDIPKSFVTLPLLAGREVIGGITIANYERENAFSDLSVNLLETIASNMGTAIQNVRLFDETQRLLKETEQRATELQIINEIGQILTEGGELNNMMERVGDKLCYAFHLDDMRIAVVDAKTGDLISPYGYRHGKRIVFEESWSAKSDRFKLARRMSARAGGKPWVVHTNVEKNWRMFAAVTDVEEIPKSYVTVPLMAGNEVIGGITIPNYEKENAFTDFPVSFLQAIASNMGTAIQNVRLFEETKRLFKEAEEARATAEHANKAKSTFLANMSHELRTPLNAIMGFTSIVRRKAEGVLPEKQIGNLDKVMSSSEHLLGLINTALDIAKIEAGRMDVIPAKFNLSGLADQCANLAIPLLKPNVTLEKQADETIGTIYSDQDKIKQIVLNLLSNAVKFTHAGSILLRVDNFNAENVNISVTDSGIGISEEALGRVFEEFQQADNTTTRQYGGTGLGLAISRNLAR
ncbi:MAG TPA: GAF domain-containing protein, partial [Anaerolineales bacterium]|nr:GAF domain-containing protein [Anaerolineales bacterium]